MRIIMWCWIGVELRGRAKLFSQDSVKNSSYRQDYILGNMTLSEDTAVGCVLMMI